MSEDYTFACPKCSDTGKARAPEGHFMGGVVYRCDACRVPGPVERKIGSKDAAPEEGSDGKA